MTTEHENAPSAAWTTLAASLDGSFSARARGLLNPKITLFDAGGEPFGRLEPHRTKGATFTTDDVDASIERADTSRQEMTSDGKPLLASQNKGSATTLEIQAAGQPYEANLSLLRNRAAARTPDGHTAARISGGLSNRRHEATFDPADPNALPIALFLLHRLNVLRSRAYRTR